MTAEKTRLEHEFFEQADMLREMYGHLTTEHERLRSHCEDLQRVADAGAVAQTTLRRQRAHRYDTARQQARRQQLSMCLHGWHAFSADRCRCRVARDRSVLAFVRHRSVRFCATMSKAFFAAWVSAVRQAGVHRLGDEHKSQCDRLREQNDAANMLAAAMERRWKMEAKLEAQRALQAETENQRLQLDAQRAASLLEETVGRQADALAVAVGAEADVAAKLERQSQLLVSKGKELAALHAAFDTAEQTVPASEQPGLLDQDAVATERERAMDSLHGGLQSALERAESKLAACRLELLAARHEQEAQQEPLEPEAATHQQLEEPKLGATSQREEVEKQSPKKSANTAVNEIQQYKLRNTTMVRSGVEAGTVACGRISVGEVIEALDFAVSSQGVRRVRFGRGWVSMVARNGTPLLEPVGLPTRSVPLPTQHGSSSLETKIAAHEVAAATGGNQLVELAAAHAAAMGEAGQAAAAKLEAELSALRSALGAEHAAAVGEVETARTADLVASAIEEKVLAVEDALRSAHASEVAELKSAMGLAMAAARVATVDASVALEVAHGFATQEREVAAVVVTVAQASEAVVAVAAIASALQAEARVEGVSSSSSSASSSTSDSGSGSCSDSDIDSDRTFEPESEPELLPPPLELEPEPQELPEPPLLGVASPYYTVLNRTMVRSGVEADTVACGPISVGEVIEALDFAVSSQGVRRVRFGRGWVSMVARNGTPLLELVSDRV